ncbi:oligosaccharide repeat unit polymerase [Gammaproteobacteria bacterium]|nr:oligosaccharide repeat unit polymerase [Gammaproteobacteria bacterium]
MYSYNFFFKTKFCSYFFINTISFITLTLSPILIYIYFYTFLNISSFAELNALRSGGLSGMGYIIFPITIVIPTLMQFWFIINFKQGGNYKLPMIMMLITCFFGLLLGFRGPVIALILQALFLLNICKIKIPLRKLLIFSIIGGFVFSIFGALRYLSIDLFLQEDNIYTILTNSLLDSSLTRFRGIETFIILLNNAEPGSLSFLSILKEGSLSWIPSSIISKDISTTELVATEYFNSYLYDAGIIKDIYGGVSYGFIGESYIVFGISGILIYSFIYAFFFKQADRSHKIENISWLSLIFQKSFIGFSFFLVESPQLGLNAIITNIIYNLILLIILILISSFFRAFR